MTDVPLVSVIIPMHGRSHFIEAALRSVIAQTHPRVETILVDDNGEGSANQLATHEQIAPFLGPNVCYWANPTNVGVSATRNRGVELARGEYVTFLDDDDIYYEDKVSSQLQEMLDRGLDISICSFDRFDSEDKKDFPSAIQPRLECAQDLFFEKPSPHAPTIMLKRSLFMQIGGFNENLAYREDLMLVTRALSHHAVLGSIKKPLFNYRVHPGFRLSKKKFTCQEIEDIDSVRSEEEAALRARLTSKELDELMLIRSYKKLDTLYKNGCRISFSLVMTVTRFSVKKASMKTMLRGLAKYLKSIVRSTVQ